MLTRIRANLSLRRLVFPFLLALLFASNNSSAAETVIARIELNQQSKGELFLVLDRDDFLIKEADLRSMGFRNGVGAPDDTTERLVPLKSIAGLSYTFDESSLTLTISAPPALLAKQTLDFSPTQTQGRHSADSSAFLNYRLDYHTDDSFGFRAFSATGELGARRGDLLFLTDSLYIRQKEDENLVRLMTSFIYDRREKMQRFTAGDFFTSSGELGSSLNVGGFSFSKIYRMDPYFITRPLLNFSGMVPLPSDLEVYLDGARIETGRLSPGEFELANIAAHGGPSTLEVLIRDPFGREQRLYAPFYSTDLLLRRGLSDYSYNAGLQRRDFGDKSFRYSGAALSGYHRYGLTDWLTIGIRGEGGNEAGNVGPEGAFRIGTAGVITASTAASLASGGSEGAAGSVAYYYQGKQVSGRLKIRGYSDRYAIVADLGRRENIEHELLVGMGYGSRPFGSLSFDLIRTVLRDDENRWLGALNYSRSLSKNSTLSASYRHIVQKSSSVDEFFVGLSFYPRQDVTFSTSHERSGKSSAEIVQVQKNLPFGEGAGYRASVERVDMEDGPSATRFAPSVRYNARYGTYAADILVEETEGGVHGDYHLSASGAVSHVGGTTRFSRPVTDSFALVSVGSLEGVPVYYNNQEIGRTDSAGKLLVPNLGSFLDNQISISDKAIPLDYLLSSRRETISPPFRSGTCVTFEARRLQAFTGRLTGIGHSGAAPLEFASVSFIRDGKTYSFQTGSGGEFYFDNNFFEGEGEKGKSDCGADRGSHLPPGTYKAAVTVDGNTHPFDLVIPPAEGPFVDLGEVSCETRTTSAANIYIAPAKPLSTAKADPPTVEVEGAHFAKSHPAPAISKPLDGPGLELEILFPKGSASVQLSEREKLHSAARLLKTGWGAFIEGHADQVGPEKHNRQLSAARAKAVMQRLSLLGVPQERLEWRAYGESKPACSSMTDDCLSKNRRVLIRMINGPADEAER